jgi:hypothetical protein
LVCSQLSDVFKQKAQEHSNVTVDDFVLAYMKSHDLHYESGSADYEILKFGIKDDYLKDKSFVGNNLDDIYNQFNTKTQQATKFNNVLNFLSNIANNNGGSKPYILLLPHSQGNLYANELYEYATSTGAIMPDHLAIYGIANPASKIDGVVNPAVLFNAPHYTTAGNDLVINGLRVFSAITPATNEPMVANTYLSKCGDFDVCHSLIDAYLADSTGNLAITQIMDAFLLYFKQAIMASPSTSFISLKGKDTIPGIFGDMRILSPNGNVICENHICDINLFDYLNIGSTTNDHYDQAYIGYSEKLTPGEYLLTTQPDYPYISYTVMFLGNNVSSFSFQLISCATYSPDTQCSSVFNQLQVYKYPNITGVVNAQTKDYISLVPTAYYNGQYILGKIVIN